MLLCFFEKFILFHYFSVTHAFFFRLKEELILYKELLIKSNHFYFSNDKTITPPFGRSLLLPFLLKKYFRSPAMQRFFEQNWKQNKLAQFDGLIISSLLRQTKLVRSIRPQIYKNVECGLDS